jgi:phosphoribosylformimino-5-aminoimidazole carboxamide ribotide isomerase
VLDLSCRKRNGRYYVVTDRWQTFTSMEVCATSLAQLARSASEFLVHGVDVEGMRLGCDSDLVALLGAASPLPVTYAGGAASLQDLDAVAAAGAGRVDVTVGSALDIFGGALRYVDVLAWHRGASAAAGGARTNVGAT